MIGSCHVFIIASFSYWQRPLSRPSRYSGGAHAGCSSLNIVWGNYVEIILFALWLFIFRLRNRIVQTRFFSLVFAVTNFDFFWLVICLLNSKLWRVFISAFVQTSWDSFVVAFLSNLFKLFNYDFPCNEIKKPKLGNIYIIYSTLFLNVIFSERQITWFVLTQLTVSGT
jgi:hypothetical protein